MKWYQYLIARAVFRTLDRIERDEEKQERWEKREYWRSCERKFDKGAWVYNAHQEMNIFVPPRKNLHFVTTTYEGDSCTIVLSKKTISIESMQYDYPWEAESECELIASIRRDNGWGVIIKREAPMFVADDDMGCPYCKNSQPALNWVCNSLKQEILDIPDNLKYHDPENVVKTDIYRIADNLLTCYWCPICNKCVEKDLVIRKGEEWNLEFMQELRPSTVLSPLERKNIDLREKEDRLQQEIENYVGCLSSPVDKGQAFHGGLIVRTLFHVATKKGELYTEKWVKINEWVPERFPLTVEVATSYFHDEKFLLQYNKAERGSVLLRHCPISEFKRYFPFYCVNESHLAKLKERYNAGEPLPIVITYVGFDETLEVSTMDGDKSSMDLVWFAREVGLTHVPVVIQGSAKRKRELEDNFKDRVFVLDIDRKSGMPLKQGQVYRKWNNKS